MEVFLFSVFLCELESLSIAGGVSGEKESDRSTVVEDRSLSLNIRKLSTRVLLWSVLNEKVGGAPRIDRWVSNSVLCILSHLGSETTIDIYFLITSKSAGGKAIPYMTAKHSIAEAMNWKTAVIRNRTRIKMGLHPLSKSCTKIPNKYK
jgi:hypothetical protein